MSIENRIRLVTDSRSSVRLDVGTAWQGRPAILLNMPHYMCLDRGQDRKTLIRVRDELTRLLRNYERPMKRRTSGEISDPPVCRVCGYRDFECRCG